MLSIYYSLYTPFLVNQLSYMNNNSYLRAINMQKQYELEFYL